MSDLYVLDESGEKPMRCASLEKWGRWFESSNRRVGGTHLDNGKIFISTVFLGVDHNFGDGVPVLWECMVFAPDARECERCAGNREQALAMHAAMVERIEAVLALAQGIPAEA